MQMENTINEINLLIKNIINTKNLFKKCNDKVLKTKNIPKINGMEIMTMY